MQTNAIHYSCHQLICGDSACNSFQTDVVPDHIVCIEQAFALHIIFCQTQCRQVVTIEYNYSRFASLIHHIHQILGENIHFANLIRIISPLVVFLCRFCSPCIQMRFVNHFLFRITAVALYSDRKHKVLLFCGIQTVIDVFQQHFVLCPAIGSHIKIHEFLADKSFKACVVENFRTAVEVTAVVMDRMSTITEGFEGCCSTFCCSFLQICFVRVFTGAEIAQVHTCDHFKFCICCTCTNGRHLTVTGRIFRCHLSQVRQRVCCGFQSFEFRCIKERFQLNYDHIGAFFCIRCAFYNFAIVCDIRHHFFCITVRFGNTCVEDTCCKTVRQTIILICKGNICKICGNDTILNDIICQHTIAAERSRYHCCRQQIIDLTFQTSHCSPQINEEEHNKDSPKTQRNQFFYAEIVGEQGDPFRYSLQVLRIKGGHSSGKHDTIDDTKYQPEDAQDRTAKGPAFEQVNDGECHKDHKCVIQKRLR